MGVNGRSLRNEGRWRGGTHGVRGAIGPKGVKKDSRIVDAEMGGRMVVGLAVVAGRRGWCARRGGGRFKARLVLLLRALSGIVPLVLYQVVLSPVLFPDQGTILGREEEGFRGPHGLCCRQQPIDGTGPDVGADGALQDRGFGGIGSLECHDSDVD